MKLLVVGAAPAGLATNAWGPFDVEPCADLDAAAERMRLQPYDAVLVRGDAALAERVATWPALSHAVLDAAVVVSWPEPAPALALRLLSLGVQDAIGATVDPGRALRMAIERKALETAARKAYATDLATGLPNHAQLLEHMTHLLALREREPAPMALIVLRAEGLATVHERLGAVAVNVLRRKVAVRLRAALRASDVVAATGADQFAVLLAWIDAPADAPRVLAKLVQALQQPFNVAGESVALAIAAGLAQYPEHSKDADALLRRAIGQAAGVAALGREGFANRAERGPATAANDDEG